MKFENKRGGYQKGLRPARLDSDWKKKTLQPAWGDKEHTLTPQATAEQGREIKRSNKGWVVVVNKGKEERLCEGGDLLLQTSSTGLCGKRSLNLLSSPTRPVI